MGFLKAKLAFSLADKVPSLHGVYYLVRKTQLKVVQTHTHTDTYLYELSFDI